MKQRFIIKGWYDRVTLFDAYDEKAHQIFNYSIAKNLKPKANSISLNLLICDSYTYNKVVNERLVTNIASFRTLQELSIYAISRLKTHIHCGKRVFFYPGVIAESVKMSLMQDKKFASAID